MLIKCTIKSAQCTEKIKCTKILLVILCKSIDPERAVFRLRIKYFAEFCGILRNFVISRYSELFIAEDFSR